VNGIGPNLMGIQDTVHIHLGKAQEGNIAENKARRIYPPRTQRFGQKYILGSSCAVWTNIAQSGLSKCVSLTK
jgi:hypothetical protein